MKLSEKITRMERPAAASVARGSSGSNGSGNGAKRPPNAWNAMKRRVRTQVLTEVAPSLGRGDDETLRAEVTGALDRLLDGDGAPRIDAKQRREFLDEIEADLLGYGPLDVFLSDPAINEIMCNSADEIWIERDGRIERSPTTFTDSEHYRAVIDKIVSGAGRRLDESSPMVDARLPDGSRVNAIVPPLSTRAPVLTIRRFRPDAYTIKDLINLNTVSLEAALFFEACVRGRCNMLISGGTGSGKTTTLNVLSSFIPAGERIITIEDAAELRLQQPHIVSLEMRPPNAEGRGEVRIRDLVRNALRMRPDRIVVGEVRGGEALDMLQAMNTGHEGSLTTVHSNSPRDSLIRLETMVLMAGFDLPVRAIREQIASAIDVVVHQERQRDGSRAVTQICELQGMEGQTLVLQTLFERTHGKLRPSGLRPRLLDRLSAHGIALPPPWGAASPDSTTRGARNGRGRR